MMRRKILMFSLLIMAIFAWGVILQSKSSADEITSDEGNKGKMQHYVEQGNTYFNQKLYNEAIKNYKKALEFKKLPYIYRWLGNAYFMMGDYKNAEIQYLEVIHLAENQYKDTMHINRNVIDAYQNLSYLYSKDSKYDKVIAICNKGLGVYPGNVFLLNNLANAYMKKGLYNEAISTIEKALAIDSNLAVAHCTYGEILEKTGDYAKALNEYDKIKNDLNFGNYAQERLSKINNFIRDRP